MKDHLSIGSKAPDFNLPSTDGNSYSLNSFTNELLVVIFTCNHCPYAQAYENRLIKLQAEYKNKVNFIAINANDSSDYPDDNYENMKKRVKEKKINYPYLRDETQEVAKKYGASYTPEVFVFDKERILKYHGRIDDNWQEPNKATKENLREAIECLLKGQEPERANTQAIGCTVKWSN